MGEEKAKVSFEVNKEFISEERSWPQIWRYFYSKIVLLPIPEVRNEDEETDLLAKWLINGIGLVFSLLTIEDSDELYPEQEGIAIEVKSIRYERSRVNRKICLAHKGYKCSICGFDFYEKYGEIGKDFIEVHHTTPVSEMGEGYKIDIDRDLIPVCSNCHSMLHRRKPPFRPEDIKKKIVESDTRNKS